MDLNWFWNQWYFGAGHPRLTISYMYNDTAKNVKVIVKQNQEKIFRLPISVDVYNGSKKERHKLWINNRTDTFTISYTQKPDLVNVDGDKMLLAEKMDNKTLDNFIHQYKYAGTYLDRREAIDFASTSDDPRAFEFLKTTAKDKFAGLRIYTLNKFDLREAKVRNEIEPILADLAANDPKTTVKAAAMSVLAAYGDEKYKDLFQKHVNDSSYSVAGAALEGLLMVDSSAAIQQARKTSNERVKGKLLESLTKVMMLTGDEAGFDMIANTFDEMPPNQSKFNLIVPFSQMLVKINDTEKVKKGIDMIVEFRDQIPAEYGIAPYINNILNSVAAKKQGSNNPAAQEQVAYIKDKVGGK
jgi:aminopeptidase N